MAGMANRAYRSQGGPYDVCVPCAVVVAAKALLCIGLMTIAAGND